LTAAGDEAGLAEVEAQVDDAEAELWGVTDRESQEIRRSLKEIAGRGSPARYSSDRHLDDLTTPAFCGMFQTYAYLFCFCRYS